MSRIKQPKTFEEATGVSSIQCLFCYTFFAQDARFSGLSYLHTSEEVRIQKILTDLFSFYTHRMLNSREC